MGKNKTCSLKRATPLGRRRSHPIFRIVCGVFFFFQIIQQIDVIRVIEFVPFGDGGGGHAAALGEGFDNSSLEVRIEDVADTDHGGILAGETFG